MTLYQKSGGAPQTLPFDDIDPAGSAWTELADNPGGRAACGWTPAPDAPEATAGNTVQWVDGGWAQVPIPPAPPLPRVISRIDFIRRFTTPELAAIQGSTDPLVRNFLFMLTVISDVELDNTDTANGVGYLEQQALIAAGRAAQVLA